MSKLVLDVEYNYDFLLTAIVSPSKDYQVCFHLNNHLNYHLKKQEDLEINLPKSRKMATFSLYEYWDEEMQVQHYLIGNKTRGDFLIPELEMADYLLLQKENYDSIDQTDLIKKIKAIPTVQTALKIEPQNLKSKQNLLF